MLEKLECGPMPNMTMTVARVPPHAPREQLISAVGDRTPTMFGMVVLA